MYLCISADDFHNHTCGRPFVRCLHLAHAYAGGVCQPGCGRGRGFAALFLSRGGAFAIIHCARIRF